MDLAYRKLAETQQCTTNTSGGKTLELEVEQPPPQVSVRAEYGVRVWKRMLAVHPAMTWVSTYNGGVFGFFKRTVVFSF